MGIISLGFELIDRASSLVATDMQVFLAGSSRLLVHKPVFVQGFVSPPAFAVLLIPLTKLPYPIAYGIFIGIGVVSLSLAVWLFAQALGFNRPLAVIAVLLSPMGWWGLMLGQPDAIITACLLGIAFCLWQKHWFWAGILTPWLWLKPDLTWPVVFCLGYLLLSHRAILWNYLKGLGISSIAFLALGGWLLPAWGLSLLHYGGHTPFRPLLSGLPDLLGGEMSLVSLHHIFVAPFTMPIIAVGIISMMFALYFVPRRIPDLNAKLVWGISLPLAFWLAVSPYIHAEDELLALPLVMLLLYRTPQELPKLMIFFSLLPFVIFPIWGALAAIPTFLLALVSLWRIASANPQLRPVGDNHNITPLPLEPQ